MIRTQLQAVSTTTGAGKVFAQLAINIVIRHMANSLLYIAGPFVASALRSAAATVAAAFSSVAADRLWLLPCWSRAHGQPKCASDNGQQRSCQTNNHFNAHEDLIPVQI
jgi:hypothetical protein